MGQMRAKVANVNEAGAQLHDAIGLRVGDPIQFQMLQERVNAVVQWATDSRAGLSFHPPISIDQIDVIRSKIKAPKHTPSGPAGLSTAL